MTLEEAKKLKIGDRILVEMEVGCNDNNEIIDRDGDIWLTRRYVKPERIREKLRNKFRKGDIVAVKNEAIYYVFEDEQEERKVYLSATGKDTWDVRLDASDLTLICAAKDRADRKEGV